MYKSIIYIFCAGIVLLSGSSEAFAQELIQDAQTVVRGEVIKIIEEGTRELVGLDVSSEYQKIEVEILEGEDKGRKVIVENDYVMLEEGEGLYVLRTVRGETGDVVYGISDPDRMPTILFLTALFLVLVFVFGGIQGVRGLLSLIGSLVLIFYVLLPQIIAGYSPILISVGVASLIIVLGSYVTHGFNKTTSSAVLGMIVTVVMTGLLAHWSVIASRLTGFGSEEAIYINFNSRGEIDIVGLLLGGILIGLLGVLYDVAIGQAVSVEELHKIGPHLPRSYIYKRAIRMGREHIGALVNTLAIAYVGAALPLLLLFYYSQNPYGSIINKEVFATEIVRTLVGSIGLVIAVPITTFIAVMILIPNKRGPIEKGLIEEEKSRTEHVGHHHH